jgi:hypothetical protein
MSYNCYINTLGQLWINPPTNISLAINTYWEVQVFSAATSDIRGLKFPSTTTNELFEI